MYGQYDPARYPSGNPYQYPHRSGPMSIWAFVALAVACVTVLGLAAIVWYVESKRPANVTFRVIPGPGASPLPVITHLTTDDYVRQSFALFAWGSANPGLVLPGGKKVAPAAPRVTIVHKRSYRCPANSTTVRPQSAQHLLCSDGSTIFIAAQTIKTQATDSPMLAAQKIATLYYYSYLRGTGTEDDIRIRRGANCYTGVTLRRLNDGGFITPAQWSAYIAALDPAYRPMAQRGYDAASLATDSTGYAGCYNEYVRDS